MKLVRRFSVGTCIVAATIVVWTNAQSGVVQDESSPLSSCTDVALSPAVDGLIKPVLLARVAAGQRWDDVFEDRFYELLKRRGAAALEAKVALMGYYCGEHYGEELVETVLKHSRKADSLVQLYRHCRPTTSFEEELEGMVVLDSLYGIYEATRGEQK